MVSVTPTKRSAVLGTLPRCDTRRSQRLYCPHSSLSSRVNRAMVSSITQARLPSARGSQLNAEAIRGLREGNFQIFQLDATAYPGNSGGPLFDAVSGEVVGVMNMVLLKGTRESALSQPSGISYAIPARHVRDMLARRVGSAELPLKAEHAQGPEGQSQQ